ncbi:hypothetical protein GT347_23665 [Xylophilus rhododendri]|uniref:Uncharacterized protein n=1 Tax=Xylophilus rhododendri TaxID=2697032 RepID=A0A857JDH2_9BURK|nr:hypothetical protein [Xylophilus rhododendri]QHJ00716.1 hypothetical protein GT347_23665 [Xylophilus rhododendri]
MDSRFPGLPPRLPDTGTSGCTAAELIQKIRSCEKKEAPALVAALRAMMECQPPVNAAHRVDAGKVPAGHEAELQALVDRAFRVEHHQACIAAIARLFNELEADARRDPVALALAIQHDELTLWGNHPAEVLSAHMPHLIETMLAWGLIDARHAPLARTAARRVAHYEALYQGRLGMTPEPELALTGARRTRLFTARLLRAAMDPASLATTLADPDRWASLIGLPQLQGPMHLSAYRALIKDLFGLVDDMQASAFLEVQHCELLRGLIPDIVRARHRQDRAKHRIPDDWNAHDQNTSAFDADALVSALRSLPTFDDARLRELKSAVKDFYRHGRMTHPEFDFAARFGPMTQCLQEDAGKARAFLICLKKRGF